VPRAWGFLTNHALVLIYVVRHHDCIVRDIARGIGVTERATLAILSELDAEGIVIRRRDGRRNRYAVDFERLAAYRRAGTVALTPREFVDRLIAALLEIANYHGGAESVRGVPADSGALEPVIGRWGFLTNHALVLLAIALDRTSTVRELANAVGLTERAVVVLLNQLEEEGLVVRSKRGRRNAYRIDYEKLRKFPRWSPGEWKIPAQLVDIATRGLRALAAASAGQAEAAG
jgi:DNA-binding MarR family transcriptional regulator